jgi:hypothetical protein
MEEQIDKLTSNFGVINVLQKELGLNINDTELSEAKKQATIELIFKGLLEPSKGYLKKDVLLSDCYVYFSTDNKFLSKGTSVFLYKGRFTDSVHLSQVKKVSLYNIENVEQTLEIPSEYIDWNFDTPEYREILDKYVLINGRGAFCEFFYDYLENVHKKSA